MKYSLFGSSRQSGRLRRLSSWKTFFARRASKRDTNYLKSRYYG